MVGASLIFVITKLKLLVAVPKVSVTLTVMVTVPNWLDFGVMDKVRASPVVLATMAVFVTMFWLSETALSFRLSTGVSVSFTVTFTVAVVSSPMVTKFVERLSVGVVHRVNVQEAIEPESTSWSSRTYKLQVPFGLALVNTLKAAP